MGPGKGGRGDELYRPRRDLYDKDRVQVRREEDLRQQYGEPVVLLSRGGEASRLNIKKSKGRGTNSRPFFSGRLQFCNKLNPKIRGTSYGLSDSGCNPEPALKQMGFFSSLRKAPSQSSPLAAPGPLTSAPSAPRPAARPGLASRPSRRRLPV